MLRMHVYMIFIVIELYTRFRKYCMLFPVNLLKFYHIQIFYVVYKINCKNKLSVNYHRILHLYHSPIYYYIVLNYIIL